MNTNDGGPAYPVKWIDWHNQAVACMTIRDHFAGLAMQALIAGAAMIQTDVLCCEAYVWADGMIRAREAGQ